MRKTLGGRIRRWAAEFRRRMQEHGAVDTWRWLYGHGVPTVLRIPIIKYHRVTDRIFLGPQHGNLGKRLLAGAGITASVNLRFAYDDLAHGLGFGEYCHLSTKDGTPPTLEQLRKGVEFIRHVIQDGGRVYIHCQTGLGRGPTMAVAYLISEGRSIDEAFEIIHAVRPFTEIQPSQIDGLRTFERESFLLNSRGR